MTRLIYLAVLGSTLLLYGPDSFAADAAALCRELSAQVRKAESGHKSPAFAETRNATRLCINQFQACTKGETLAERFWETTRNAEDAAAIKAELTGNFGWSGEVTHIHVNGHKTPVTRIARYIGSAHWKRDTYLEQRASGYRLIDNASLQELSQEAGNCRGSYVSYVTRGGNTYAILVEPGENWHQLTAMKADTRLNLTKVCSTRWDVGHAGAAE